MRKREWQSNFYSDEATLDAVSGVLASFDTSVSALRKEEVSIEELDRYAPANQLTLLQNAISSMAANAVSTGPISPTFRSNDVFVSIEDTPGWKHQ